MMASFNVLARSFSTSGIVSQMVKPPVQVFGKEGLYATALYSAASKKKSLPVVEKELVGFSGLMKTDLIFAEFLKNPLIKKELKGEAVKSVTAIKKSSELTTNLLILMAENGCIDKLEGVSNAFSTIMAAERGEVHCEVTTAKELDAATLKELQTSLKGFVKKNESIILKTKVDTSIIGGMVVSIGDKYVDMSIATKINKYHELIQQSV